MRNSGSKEDLIFLKAFSGASISCMHHHVQPSLKHEPQLLVIHCRTNSFRSNKDETQIANDMI